MTRHLLIWAVDLEFRACASLSTPLPPLPPTSPPRLLACVFLGIKSTDIGFEIDFI